MTRPAAELAFTDEELLARSDAPATIERLFAVMHPEAPEPELTVELVALAVLRARAAKERSGR